VAAFFIEFLGHLNLRPINSPPLENTESDMPVQLVFGGYSYGSLITTRLPETDVILKRLSEQTKVATEIRTRARDFSMQVNEDFASVSSPTHLGILGEEPVRLSFDHTLAVGTEEDVKAAQGKHGGHVDVRKSLDNVSRRISKHFKHPLQDKISEDKMDDTSTENISSLPSVKASYLLISPLLPPISSLTTLSLSFFSDASTKDYLQKLKSQPTLAIYGGHDIFTSAKKVRTWCSEILQTNQNFRGVEISEASHFWTEKGVASKLGAAVKEWIGEIEKQT
jgi:hypothetical protein